MTVAKTKYLLISNTWLCQGCVFFFKFILQYHGFGYVDDFPSAGTHPCLEYGSQPAASSHSQNLGRNFPKEDFKVSKITYTYSLGFEIEAVGRTNGVPAIMEISF